MDMTDVISLVNTNRGNGKKESLNRMKALLDKLGNPQNKLQFIHIAGTNGKGSTASFLSAILEQTTIKTGVFTSPHLEKINERIRVNQINITDQDFIRITETVAPFVDEVENELNEKLYSFEILTAVAFLYFAENKCELVILEAGIGGRLDATNTIPTPEVAVITSIGLDHMKVLGDSKESIAREKAGIIKENGALVFSEMEENLETIFYEKARERRAKAIKVKAADVRNLVLTENTSVFSYKCFKQVRIHLIGMHQVMNACLAIEAIEILQTKGYPINDSAIHKGLDEARWAGRMEKISDEPLIILDGAHNPAGVHSLKETIETLFKNEKLTFVVGMMKDKKYHDMIETMLPFADRMYTVSPDEYRGFDAKSVSDWIREKGIESKSCESVDSVIDTLKNESDDSDKIIVFGSLYLIGEFREKWKQISETLYSI
ncbi:folylpolyglutamate synthase/dihydrofolate synthase family protein [Alkalibacterium iburiense]|uniref:tetrahydrofolate synthase n=1 Tax=Alkalibacterium iburiense TaxID=290589 RepID=A0ABN0XNY8_9LACT